MHRKYSFQVAIKTLTWKLYFMKMFLLISKSFTGCSSCVNNKKNLISHI